MRKLVFVIGPPSSGKTSFALWLEKNHGFTRFSSDDYRTEEERIKGDYQPAFLRIGEAIKQCSTNVVYDAQNLYYKARAKRLRDWMDNFDMTMAMVMIRHHDSCVKAEMARKDRHGEGHRNAVLHMINSAYMGFYPFLSKGWWDFLRQEPWSEIWEVRWIPNLPGEYHFKRHTS